MQNAYLILSSNSFLDKAFDRSSKELRKQKLLLSPYFKKKIDSFSILRIRKASPMGLLLMFRVFCFFSRTAIC